MKRLSAIVVLFAVVGCARLHATDRKEASYFPLSADRVWEYRFHGLANGDVWPVTVHSRGPRFIEGLGRVAAIFDEQYPDQLVPVAFFLSDGFLQSAIGLRYRLAERVEVAPIGIQPMRIMPVPPRVGMRWQYFERVFAVTGEDAEFEIRWNASVSREESVAVPAGTFGDCLRIESVAVHRTPVDGKERRHRYVDWYAPNVGLVRNEYAADSEPLTRMELVRYGEDDGSETPAEEAGATDWRTALLDRRP